MLEERRKELDEAKTIYMLCHTGDRSQEYVEELEDEGYDAVNVEGGYRAYLRLSLSRFMQGDCQKEKEEKKEEIERSIIKKYRRAIWRQLIRIPAISVRECDGDICIPRQRNWDVIRLR